VEGYPSVSELGPDRYVVAWSYDDGDTGGDLVIIDAGGEIYADVPAELDVRALLTTGSSGQIQSQAGAQGVWLTWIDAGVAMSGTVARGISASLLRAM
jgi:hypothetical protein